MKVGDERLAEMLAAAEKATPGPWFQTGAPWFRDGTGVLAGSPDGNVAFLIADTDDFAAPRDEYEGFPLGDKEDDARHIANCDPQTITAIITELVELRKGQRAVSEALTDWKPEPALSSLSNSTEPAHLAEMQLSADLPHPPTETTFVFRQAVGLQGPRAADWQDKPHRLVYDLCQIIEAEAVEKAALITELVELRKATNPADDCESILHALQIAGMGAPFTDVQGNLYCHRPYSPDGYRDAEFRDYGLARAVRIICNNAKFLASALSSPTLNSEDKFRDA